VVICLQKENAFFRSKIKEMERQFESLNEEIPSEIAGQSLLNRMMKQAVSQLGKKPKGF